MFAFAGGIIIAAAVISLIRSGWRLWSSDAATNEDAIANERNGLIIMVVGSLLAVAVIVIGANGWL
jgi:hypothetical protein